MTDAERITLTLEWIDREIRLLERQKLEFKALRSSVQYSSAHGKISVLETIRSMLKGK